MLNTRTAPLYLLAIITLLIFSATTAISETKYKKSIESYTIPNVTLINQDGKRVHLPTIIESDTAVVIDFVYATCTTICPVLSAGYINLQKKLVESPQKVRLISITIDPEHDNPKALKEYLARYQAKPGWDFLTGSKSDIEKVMRSLNAYIPDKMSHYPINLIRSPKTGKWTRLYGIMSSREFYAEFKAATDK